MTGMRPVGVARMLFRSAEASVIDNDFDGARAAVDALVELTVTVGLEMHPDADEVFEIAAELKDLAGFPWE